MGNTLVALLRQIRFEYTQRPGAFPQSIVLCGVRDYRIRSSAERAVVAGGARSTSKGAASVEECKPSHPFDSGIPTAEARIPKNLARTCELIDLSFMLKLAYYLLQHPEATEAEAVRALFAQTLRRKERQWLP